jgi:hypothetical protein
VPAPETSVTSAAKPSDRVLMVVIAVTLVLVVLPYILSQDVGRETYLKGDCYYYRAAVVSLLEDGDLYLSDDVGGDPFNGSLALGREGRRDRLVPKHPILMPIASLPFYAALGTVGLLVFNVAITIGVALLVFTLNRLYFTPWVSLWVALLFTIGTLFFDYAYNYSPDTFSTLLVLGGLYAALRQRHAPAAILLGLAIFAKLPNAVLVAIISLYVALDLLRLRPLPGGTRRALARLLLYAVVLLASLVPLAWTNHALYGSVTTVGYHRAVKGDGIEDTSGAFHQPYVAGLGRLLFHRRVGLVTTNPVVILSLAGIPLLLAGPHRWHAALLLALCGAQLSLFATYDFWWASHFSNRFLMTTVALLSVFCAAVIERLGRRLGLVGA